MDGAMENKPSSNTRSGDDMLSSLYEQVGGTETCRILSERFHARVVHDPVLSKLFPKDLSRITERFALFLAEQIGGPADYKRTRGKQSLRCRHAHLPIGTTEAQDWLGHMFDTMEEVAIPEPGRQILYDYFKETARTLSDSFLPLYHMPLEELKMTLRANPALATASDLGRTLLSNAAQRWDLPRVQLLLEYGADVSLKDLLGHDPLYHAANGQAPVSEEDGCTIVALLILNGANVNTQSGPGRSTPLHMAARRGNIAIAKVLLGATANIEARDSKGETPLRRAANCGQFGMVRLLISRGADPMSQDKQGRTVFDSIRNKQMLEAVKSDTPIT